MTYESYRAAPVIEVPLDSTATIIELQIVFDGSAVDITGATAILFYSKTMDGVQIDNGVAGSITNAPGTDGKVDIPVSAAFIGTARDLLCDVRYTEAGGDDVVSFPVIFRIFSGGKV